MEIQTALCAFFESGGPNGTASFRIRITTGFDQESLGGGVSDKRTSLWFLCKRLKGCVIGCSGQPLDPPKKVVTRARFERATPSFGGWCSIQLSYRATREPPTLAQP